MKRRLSMAVMSGVAILAVAQAPSPAAPTLPELPRLSIDRLLDIANIALPPAGTSLQIHVDFPEEAPLIVDGVSVYALTADIDSNGGVMTRNAVTNENSSSGGGSGSGCTDPAFVPMGVQWTAGDMPVRWRLNLDSAPSYMSRFMTLRKIRQAHQVWPRVYTDCRDDDANGFHFNFQNLTSRGVKYDGYNIVDFGHLGGGALALAYTWHNSTGKIVEVDLRLNTAHRWTNNPEGKKGYHVLNVVTHELGHQLGLDDLGDPHAGLTMFGRISAGELSKVTLGRGDIKGAATVSP